MKKRHSLKSLFYGGSKDTIFVGVEFFSRSVRGLEYVGCGDLIVVLVLDVIAVAVASNSFLLRRPFA